MAGFEIDKEALKVRVNGWLENGTITRNAVGEIYTTVYEIASQLRSAGVPSSPANSWAGHSVSVFGKDAFLEFMGVASPEQLSGKQSNQPATIAHVQMNYVVEMDVNGLADLARGLK